ASRKRPPPRRRPMPSAAPFRGWSLRSRRKMQTGSTTSAPQSAPPAELPPFLRARAETAATPDKRMRMPRFRLLPAVIRRAIILFALKVMDIAAGAADLMASPEPAKESDASAGDKASLEAVAADAQALVNDAMGGGGKDTSG